MIVNFSRLISHSYLVFGGNCVNVMRLRNSRFHIKTWTRILTTANQCVTIELRRPFLVLSISNLSWCLKQIGTMKKKPSISIILPQKALLNLLILTSNNGNVISYDLNKHKHKTYLSGPKNLYNSHEIIKYKIKL